LKNLPDPTAPENIEKPGDEEIFLMKHLSDEVEFKEGEDSGIKLLHELMAILFHSEGIDFHLPRLASLPHGLRMQFKRKGRNFIP